MELIFLYTGWIQLMFTCMHAPTICCFHSLSTQTFCKYYAGHWQCETYKAISVAIYTEIKNDPSVSAYSRVWRKGVGKQSLECENTCDSKCITTPRLTGM